MPSYACVVSDCTNSTHRVKAHKNMTCLKHDKLYKSCACEPIFRLWALPNPALKPVEYGRFCTLINRRCPDDPMALWQPARNARVCSRHFPDGSPTKENPYPIMFMGYSYNNSFNPLLKMPSWVSKVKIPVCMSVLKDVTASTSSKVVLESGSKKMGTTSPSESETTAEPARKKVKTKKKKNRVGKTLHQTTIPVCVSVLKDVTDMTSSGMDTEMDTTSPSESEATAEPMRKKVKIDNENNQTASPVKVKSRPLWRQIALENLDLEYARVFKRSEADKLLKQCEEELAYNTGQLARVQIFGKWMDIPRKQVAFGDEGLSYKFSGNAIPARAWTPFLSSVRDMIEQVSGHKFNFVLINRYRDGNDYMGEHRDDEKDLVAEAPIASLSLGQQRDFVFKHADSRGKKATQKTAPLTKSLTVQLEHGSLLMMNYPTNVYWYHSLPKRKKLPGVRINMTFRMMRI